MGNTHCDSHEECMRSLSDIFFRLRELELKEVAHTGQILSLKEDLKELSKSIDGLVEFAKVALWKFLGGIGAVTILLAGFLLWYIKQLLPVLVQSMTITGVL